METPSAKLTCAPKGLILDEAGRVAGFWVRGKKRRFHTHLLETPIEKAEESAPQIKDIIVDGELVKGVPVRVYPKVSSFLHWGK